MKDETEEQKKIRTEKMFARWGGLLKRLARGPGEVEQCAHTSLALPEFDKEVAAKLATTAEVRKKYPRKEEVCPDCGCPVILYASYSHYIYGDY